MHTSRQFARRAAAHKRPCALIFSDLVKAFDRVLRAVVMGDSSINDDPASGGHVRERWSESGVPDKIVDTETKQLVTSLSAATTSGGTTTICMWKRSSTTKPKSGRAYCRVLWVRRGHTANQASGESSQQSGRGYSSAGICEENVRTTTHRAEDTAESTTTVEQKIGKCEGCSAESSKESGGSESCVHSGPDCQRAGGPRSSENSSRTLHARTRSSQSSNRSRRCTPTRPLLGHL